MKIQEECTCRFCENEFIITYDEEIVTDKISICPFCGEELEQEEYIDDEDEYEDE